MHVEPWMMPLQFSVDRLVYIQAFKSILTQQHSDTITQLQQQQPQKHKNKHFFHANEFAVFTGHVS